MAKKQTKVRAKMVGEEARVTCLIKHPMETGNRRGADGKKVPIHYVKFVRFELNGEHVATANLGPGVSADPLVTVSIAGAKSGDNVAVAWEDNKGASDRVETVIK